MRNNVPKRLTWKLSKYLLRIRFTQKLEKAISVETKIAF